MKNYFRFTAQVLGFVIAANVYTTDLSDYGFWVKLAVYTVGAVAVSLFVWGVKSETKEEIAK